MKCALVASGGSLKAYAFHAGVLRALEEGGFRRVRADGSRGPGADDALDLGVYVGSSAGACFTASCVFFETVDDLEATIGLKRRDVPRFTRRVLYHPNWGWLRGGPAGLFAADRVEEYFAGIARPDDFRALKPELYVVATELNGSRKVVFGPRDSGVAGVYDPYIGYYADVPVSAAVAASVCVPGAFRPHPVKNPRSGEVFEYVDGEVRETLSVHVARDAGVDLVVVSNVWMPYHWDPRVGSLSRRGLGAVIGQALTQTVEQKVDRLRLERDRQAAALDLIRGYAQREGLDAARTEALLARVSDVLRCRPMDEIWIAPDARDSEFNLAPSWTFDAGHLSRARDTGYERARQALEAWRARRPAPAALRAAP